MKSINADTLARTEGKLCRSHGDGPHAVTPTNSSRPVSGLFWTEGPPESALQVPVVPFNGPVHKSVKWSGWPPGKIALKSSRHISKLRMFVVVVWRMSGRIGGGWGTIEPQPNAWILPVWMKLVGGKSIVATKSFVTKSSSTWTTLISNGLTTLPPSLL